MYVLSDLPTLEIFHQCDGTWGLGIEKGLRMQHTLKDTHTHTYLHNSSFDTYAHTPIFIIHNFQKFHLHWAIIQWNFFLFMIIIALHK